MLMSAVVLTSCDALLPLHSASETVRAEAVASASADADADADADGGAGGSQLIGSFSMPTPIAASAAGTAGYQPVTPTGITLPPRSYVLLRVGGTVEMERNPWIFGSVPGQVAFSYSAHESRQATGRGMTSLYLGLADITGSFRVDEGGRDVIRLVHNWTSSPVELNASRQGLPVADMRSGGYCLVEPYCGSDGVAGPTSAIFGLWVELYWISQSHEITATQIDKPLWIESSPLVPGSLVRAEAHLFSGLRLLTTAGLEPQINWAWYPGDPSAPTGEKFPLPKCWNKMVCEFTPNGPGRLSVATWVQGTPVHVIEFLPVEENKMGLTCPDSVLRGDEMTCTVAATPSGTLTNIKWEFAASEWYVVGGPDDVHEWGGRMVVPGSMKVSAELAGDSVFASADIHIRARTWPNMRVRAWDAGNGTLPSHPTNYPELAQTWPPVADEPYAHDRISDGPNAGWHFLTAPLTRLKAAVNISRGFQVGQPFYNLQHPGPHPVTGAPNHFCSKSQLPEVRRGAREHEGLDHSPSLVSHIEVMQMWFRNNRAQQELEAVVGHDSDFHETWSFLDLVNARFDDHVAGPAYADPNQRHTTDSPPGLVAFPTVPCATRFF